MPEQQLRPADRVAALSAIRAGIDTLLAEAKADALRAAEEVGVRSFDTPFGPVNVSRRDPAVIVADEAALLAHVKATRPEEVEVVETVRPSYVKALLSRLVVIAGHVVDPDTAEVVEWAGLSAAGEPFVTWPKSAAQVAAKDAAAEAVRSLQDGAIAGVRELLP